MTPGEPAFLLSALLPWDELVQCLLHTGHGAEAAEAISALENHTGDAERMRLGRVHSAAVRAVHEEILHTARELLQECLAGARDRRLSPMQLRVELRLAEVWAETGRSEAAGQMNTSAEETIRRLARSIEDPELRSSFLASDSAR